MSAGLIPIKHCNIAQSVPHPVTWTPGTRHHPVIYWLPGWGFTPRRINWSSQCEKEAIRLLAPGIRDFWLRDNLLFTARQRFYGCGIMIFDAGCTVIISEKLQAWNWIFLTPTVDPELTGRTWCVYRWPLFFMVIRKMGPWWPCSSCLDPQSSNFLPFS